MFNFTRAALNLEKAAESAERKDERFAAHYLGKAERLIMGRVFNDCEIRGLTAMYDRILAALGALPGPIPIKKHCEEMKVLLVESMTPSPNNILEDSVETIAQKLGNRDELPEAAGKEVEGDVPVHFGRDTTTVDSSDNLSELRVEHHLTFPKSTTSHLDLIRELVKGRLSGDPCSGSSAIVADLVDSMTEKQILALPDATVVSIVVAYYKYRAAGFDKYQSFVRIEKDREHICEGPPLDLGIPTDIASYAAIRICLEYDEGIFSDSRVYFIVRYTCDKLGYQFDGKDWTSVKYTADPVPPQQNP